MKETLIKLKKSYGQLNQNNSGLVIFLKILITALAVVYVISKINMEEITALLKSATLPYLVLASLAFIMSKAASAFRTQLILNRYDVPISKWENIKLYWTGMAYNMFLPGAIGGDVYKTVIINDRYGSGIKISAGAMITDRIAGIAVVGLIIVAFLPFTVLHGRWALLSIPGLIIMAAGAVLLCKLIMPRLKGAIGLIFAWSLLIQSLQILAVIFILKSLNINHNYFNYSFLFLLSSIATLIPFTVGGFGLREMASLTFSPLLSLDTNLAVTLSFAFYLITLLTSAFGIITAIGFKRKKYLSTT